MGMTMIQDKEMLVVSRAMFSGCSFNVCGSSGVLREGHVEGQPRGLAKLSLPDPCRNRHDGSQMVPPHQPTPTERQDGVRHFFSP
jgi:hypothetical protein